MTMSVVGEAASEREKGGDDVVELKNKEKSRC
jgi:hypothetical protein